MKLATLTNSVIIIASVALTSGIANAQPAPNRNQLPSDVATNLSSENQKQTDISYNTLSSNPSNVSYLQPFNLVSFAYQGGLKAQGIPSGGNLIFEHQNRQITANDLVQAAVNANKLPRQVLNDQSYLNAVRVQISALSREFSY